MAHLGPWGFPECAPGDSGGFPEGYLGEGAGELGGLGWTVKVGYHVASKRPSDRSPHARVAVKQKEGWLSRWYRARAAQRRRRRPAEPP